MKPNYVHLKREPSYIKDNAQFSLSDYALVCTPKRHHTYPFKTFLDYTINDVTVLSMLETTPENSKNRAGLTLSEQYSNDPSMLVLDGEFFGFYNISSFIYYTTLLWIISCEHNNEDMKKLASKELDDLSEIIFVHDTTNSSGMVCNLKEAYEQKLILIGPSTYHFLKHFIHYKKIVVNTVASKENMFFKSDMEKLRGKAHIYLKTLSTNGILSFYNTRMPSSLFTSSGDPVRNFLLRQQRVGALDCISKTVNEAFARNREYENDDDLLEDVFPVSGGYDIFDTPMLSEMGLHSICFLKNSDEKTSLDDSKKDIMARYHEQVRQFLPEKEFNAQYVGDVDEYEYYRAAISEKCKQFNIKTTFKKELCDESLNRFTVKLSFTPPNTNSMFKVFNWVADISPNATIREASWDSHENSNFIRTYEHFYKPGSHFDIREYIIKKKEQYAHDPEIVENYNIFRDKFLNMFRPRSPKLKHSKVIEIISLGLLEHDDELLRILCESIFASKTLTLTVPCNDIKDLRKLKLLGVSIKELSFHFIDRKEVLNYFENY